MSDEMRSQPTETLSPTQQKALKQQRAWGKFLNIYNIVYVIASVVLFAYVWFFMM